MEEKQLNLSYILPDYLLTFLINKIDKGIEIIIIILLSV